MDILRFEGGDHAAGLADDQVAKDLDIALDGAVDADVAVGLQCADDAGVGANHCFRPTVHRGWHIGLGLLISAEHWSSYAAPAGGICVMWSAGRPSDPQND